MTYKSRLPQLIASATLGLAMAASSAQAETLAECFDRILVSCEEDWPGQDMGDNGYGNCVTGEMEGCEFKDKQLKIIDTNTLNQYTPAKPTPTQNLRVLVPNN